MVENLKLKLKDCSKKEKFFGIFSYVMGEDITESTMLSDLVETELDKPILACDLTHDLGLDSLDIMEICFQCKEVFDIDDDIDVEMETVTVQELYDIVSEYGKGD